MPLNFLCLNCGGRGVRRDDDSDRPCNICGETLEQWSTLEAPTDAAAAFTKPRLSSPKIAAKRLAHVKRRLRKKNGHAARIEGGQRDFWDLCDGDPA